ncbi:MAG: DegT/DnrJ/EryC1/StrS family aminotransferase [Bacteriovoracia bacterium]
MILRCDLIPQYQRYDKEIHAAVDRVLCSGNYILGPEVSAFEREFADYVHAGHGVGVANATDALTLCLMALGIGAGDEVITTAYTAIPTVSAIIDAGAKPVFVDVDPNTYLIDITKIPAAITPRTKAIMPVHIFGNFVDVLALRKLVGKLPVIEDASQAHGASLGGKPAGSIGEFGVFSFYPTKNLGAYGDGGMIVTPDAEMAARLKRMRMYGMVDRDHIDITGINSRLDEMQAAILRVKLRHLDEMNENRARMAKRYQAELDPRLFDYQVITPGAKSCFHLFVPRTKVDRAALRAHFEAHQIQTTVFYPVPLHLQEANRFLGHRPGALPNVERICERALGLPIYPEMTTEIQDRVIQVANQFRMG